jgi:hypothetical protein
LALPLVFPRCVDEHAPPKKTLGEKMTRVDRKTMLVDEVWSWKCGWAWGDREQVWVDRN